MTRRAFVVLVVFWAASLFVVAEWAGAQLPRRWVPLAQPVVLTGADVGFRVHGMSDGFGGERPVGVIVIRNGDEWVEAAWGTGPGNWSRVPEPPEPPAPPR